MRYILLVHDDGGAIASLPPDEGEALTAECRAFDTMLEANGHLIAANALRPPRETRCVRRRGRKPTVTDGPYAETKEQMIGFLLIEADSMEEALRIAGEVPLARTGTVEVRPAYSIRDIG